MVQDRDFFGFLNIDKPSGMTSHDVVAQVRRKFGIKKVGHAGTLDPLATGVLVICVGDATRLSEYVMATTKTYRATIRLGIETTTYDAEGEVTGRTDVDHISCDDMEAVLPQFTGDIDQLPPIYSAIKKDGRKLYELARAGEEVELEARPVFIDSLQLTEWDAPFFTLDVVCGAGTYIRSLAHDIGAVLNVGAHLASLRRTRSGTFDVEEAVKLTAFIEAEDPAQLLIAAEEGLSAFPTVNLSPNDVADIRHGRAIQYDHDVTNSTGVGIAPDGRLVAVLSLETGLARPYKVFSSQINGT